MANAIGASRKARNADDLCPMAVPPISPSTVARLATMCFPQKVPFRYPKTIRGPVDSDRWVLPLQDGARLADPDGCHLEPVQLLFRSEEQTSEIQSLMRNSNAVFCLK